MIQVNDPAPDVVFRRPDLPGRILRQRRKGWRLPPNAVSVTRPGRFGNLWLTGWPGRFHPGSLGGDIIALPYELTREEAVKRYRSWLTSGQCWTADLRLSPGDLELWQRRGAWLADAARHHLRGRDLACWCKFDGRPCHADVLLEIANS